MNHTPASLEPDPGSRRYHRLLKSAILLALGSLAALGVKSYRSPDADNAPAPFCCSSLSTGTKAPIMSGGAQCRTGLR